jgi:glycosyltransferase involved in cell wall biosynthesis
MRVLMIYPGLNPQVNDCAHVPAYLASTGMDVAVITARQNTSKSVESSSAYEEFRDVRIHRPYERFAEMIWRPARHLAACREALATLRPDVLVCQQELNIRLTLLLQRGWPAPILLVTEFARALAEGHFGGRRVRLLWPFLGVPTWGSSFWRWLCRRVAGIITANPGDAPYLEALSQGGAPVWHVPWCSELSAYEPAPERDPGRLVYVGAFSDFKNTSELAETIPLVLEHTPVREAVLVGDGDTRVVEDLRAAYGERVRHLPGLARAEVLALLSGAFCAHTPVLVGGWGFIGDCWGTGTPLVATHDAYAFRHGVDALLAEGPEGVVAAVNGLAEDPALYARLQAGGYERHRRHTAQAVGEGYRRALERVAGRTSATGAPPEGTPAIGGGLP